MDSSRENNIDNELMSILQNMKENSFTRSVLKPLFLALKYQKVDFYGGPYENGKDLVCWRKDEFDFTELGVVQVKRYKVTARSSGNTTFCDIVNQLQQAAEHSIPYIDGHMYFPTSIYFVTPYPLDTRALQSRFEGFNSLRNGRVKIIDGNVLASSIRRYLPEVAAKLLGAEFSIKNELYPKLTNQALIDALNIRNPVDVKIIYNDLELCLGRINTRFFYRIKPNDSVVTIHANLLGADSIINNLNQIENRLNFNLFKDSKEKLRKISGESFDSNQSIKEIISKKRHWKINLRDL